MPGVIVTSGQDAAAASLPTDISTVFVVGFSEKGPTTAPSVALNLSQYKTVAGSREGNSMLYDWVETHFRCGGSKVIWMRDHGPAAAASSGNLAGAATNALKAVASSPGNWANGLKLVVSVVETTKRKLVIELNSLAIQELVFATNEEVISWASGSPYVRLSDLGGGLPKAQTVQLSGGDDDRTNATDNGAAALALFSRDLGPGKVVMPGRTTAAVAKNLLAHCEATGRVARIDGVNGSVVESEALAATLENESDARYGSAPFWPWAIVKGIAPGTTRTVPYSAVDTGLSARNAALGLSPNDAAAGENGIAPEFVVGLSQPALSEERRNQANDAGVNVAREMLGSVRTYGYRTLVNALIDDTWLDLANADTDAYIKAKCDAIGERYVKKTIDGRGRLAGQFASDITGEVLGPLYEEGALFGETPEEAYEVRVGPDVNTIQSIAERKLRAQVRVKMSEGAEWVEIEIVKEAL